MADQVDTSFYIQKQVRENTQDLERYMLDLKNWEDGMKRKEQNTFGNGNEEHKRIVTKEEVDYVKEVFEDGKRQMKNGKYELAVTSFSKAIKKFRKNPVFFLKRAKCYIRLKMAREAEMDCTKALSLDPRLLKAKYVRSQAREMRGNYRGAYLDVQDIVLLDPTLQAAKAALARIKPLYQNALREEGYDDVFSDEEKENEEDNKSILVTLTGSDRAIGDTDSDDIIKRANEEKEMGNMYVKEGNWEEAKKAYSQAILLNPEDAIYYANRALCFLKTNNEQRAVLDCTMALKKNPRYVKAYMRRAVARKGIGDFWGARSDVKQTLLLEPNNSQAKGMLEELNVLIEQKVYRDFQQLDGESSHSEEDGEETSEPQQKSEEMEVDSCSGQTEFKYVFPINKPPHARSKKPLRRVRIKMTESESGGGAPPSAGPIASPNEELIPNGHNSLKRASSGPTSEEKKLNHSKVEGDHVENIIASSSEKLDFKFVFPIDKKPHQRSKKALVRIPITFT